VDDESEVHGSPESSREKLEPDAESLRQEKVLDYGHSRSCGVSPKRVGQPDASVVYDKLTNDYPALYRKHSTDPQELAQRLSTMLEDTALRDLLPSSS